MRSFENMKPGDIVKNKGSGNRYKVKSAHYFGEQQEDPNSLTLIPEFTEILATNPAEWERVS